MTLIVLWVYTLIYVFLGCMLSFYQYNSHKFSQISHTGPSSTSLDLTATLHKSFFCTCEFSTVHCENKRKSGNKLTDYTSMQISNFSSIFMLTCELVIAKTLENECYLKD